MYVWLSDDPETLEEIILEKGDLFTMKPNLAHGIEAIKHTLVLELSQNEFDPEDNFYPNNFKKDLKS